jgi:hypothetical protein
MDVSTPRHHSASIFGGKNLERNTKPIMQRIKYTGTSQYIFFGVFFATKKIKLENPRGSMNLLA